MAIAKPKQNVDLLHGSILKSMIIFALPILVSNLFQQLYNTVDTMVVGNFLGETSLASIGASTPIYDLMVGFALGFGNGLAIATARAFGSGDRKLLKKSVACALMIDAAVAAVITILAQTGARPLLILLDTPGEILSEAYSYIATITLFTAVTLAYNLCSGILRATGNSFMPLIFLMISSVLNIVLDLLFITQLNMGIRGAAVATVISQGVSVVLCIIYIYRKNKMLVPEKQDFRLSGHLAAEMLSQGFSMGFMNCIVSAGSVVLQSGINSLGYYTIAGHTTARKIFSFCNMPFSAMAHAASTFVSQNRGANQPKRIRNAIRSVILFDIAAAGVITVFLWFAAPTLVALISGSHEPVLLENGALYARVVAPFYAVLGTVLATRFSLQGLGRKMLPLLSSVIEMVGKIIFATLMIPRFGYHAVIFCEPVIWCFMAIQLLTTFYTHPYIRHAK